MPQDVEVTVRSRVFAPHIRGLKWIVVQGFQMEYAANQWIEGFWNLGSAARYAQSGLIGTRSGQNWVIRNNTIRYAQTIGVDIGIEGGYSGMGGDNEGSCCGGVDQPTPPINETGNHTVDNNVFEHLGASSIVGYVSSGAITYNLVQNTGFQGCQGAENAAIKTHGFHGMFTNNVMRYNTHGVSIWFDGGINGRVSRNVILVPSGEPGGIVFELGFNSVVVDNNILHGGGIGVQDASGIQFVHNLVTGIGASAVSLGGLTGRASDGRTSAMKSWWVEANMLLSPSGSAFMAMHKEKKGSKGEELMCNETVQHNLVTGKPATYPTDPGLNITVEPNQDVTGQLTVGVDTDTMTISMTGGPSAGQSGCSANMPGGDIDFTGAKRGSTCAPGPFDWIPTAQARNVSLWSAYNSV